jgi:hypothetical protein
MAHSRLKATDFTPDQQPNHSGHRPETAHSRRMSQIEREWRLSALTKCRPA